jgi:hypothetical protein
MLLLDCLAMTVHGISGITRQNMPGFSGLIRLYVQKTMTMAGKKILTFNPNMVLPNMHFLFCFFLLGQMEGS